MSGAHDGHPIGITLYNDARSPAWVLSTITTWAWVRDLLLTCAPNAGAAPAWDGTSKKPEDVAKLGAPCWSPVTWAPGALKRKAADVAFVWALALDYDDGVGPAEALDRWAGFERLVYTSWSHSAEKPKCRLVMPLAEAVPGRVWSGVYRKIIEDEGKGRAGIDAKTLDPSRIWFAHAVGHGGPHYARARGGALLSLVDLAIRVEDEAREAAERAEVERAARLAAARAARAQAERVEGRGESAAGRLRRRLFALDPDLRLSVALFGGAKVVDTAGGKAARKARCPACGQQSAWFGIDRGRVRCDHVQSCGYGVGDGVALIDYADAVGFVADVGLGVR